MPKSVINDQFSVFPVGMKHVTNPKHSPGTGTKPLHREDFSTVPTGIAQPDVLQLMAHAMAVHIHHVPLDRAAGIGGF